MHQNTALSQDHFWVKNLRMILYRNVAFSETQNNTNQGKHMTIFHFHFILGKEIFNSLYNHLELITK